MSHHYNFTLSLLQGQPLSFSHPIFEFRKRFLLLEAQREEVLCWINSVKMASR